MFRRVKGHRNLLHYSPLVKKTGVRQVVLDKWFPLTQAQTTGPRTRLAAEPGTQAIAQGSVWLAGQGRARARARSRARARARAGQIHRQDISYGTVRANAGKDCRISWVYLLRGLWLSITSSGCTGVKLLSCRSRQGKQPCHTGLRWTPCCNQHLSLRPGREANVSDLSKAYGLQGVPTMLNTFLV